MKLYPLFRSLLFRLEAEQAHHLTLGLVGLAGNIPPLRWGLQQAYSIPGNPVQAFGITFKNPIGLAAGYDKDGTGWKGLACLGFSHIEIGTVTPKAQPGNPKPRIFRLIAEKALINRMGFPSLGADFVVKQLSKVRQEDVVIGVNIGKNKDTLLDEAVEDYLDLFRSFVQRADYITINVSSPNTVGLRRLQEKQALSVLLSELYLEREKLQTGALKKTAILVKLSPDLTDSELDDALQVIQGEKIDGVIATNTTLSREGIRHDLAKENGGLSGEPLFTRSLDMVSKIIQRTSGKLPVIGVGGISNAAGVQKMLDAGAVLVQLYTGLIYEGPGLVKKILLNLQE